MRGFTRLSRVLWLWSLIFIDRWQRGVRSLRAIVRHAGALWSGCGIFSVIGGLTEGRQWPHSVEPGKDPPGQAIGGNPLITPAVISAEGLRVVGPLLESPRASSPWDDESSQGAWPGVRNVSYRRT